MSSRGVSPAHVPGATAIPTPSLGIFPRPRQLPPCPWWSPEPEQRPASYPTPRPGTQNDTQVRPTITSWLNLEGRQAKLLERDPRRSRRKICCKRLGCLVSTLKDPGITLPRYRFQAYSFELECRQPMRRKTSDQRNQTAAWELWSRGSTSPKAAAQRKGHLTQKLI